jgi:hypothetical protein
MSIKDDELYPIYISYLENKKMKSGAYKLAQISESMFNDFVHRYETNIEFQKKQDNIYKKIKRDIVIGQILEEEDDFEIFLNDLNIVTSCNSTNFDDYFFDF